MRRIPLMALALAACTLPALASGPVPRTITGCVQNGHMTSDDGYHITVLNQNNTPMALAGFNGKRIRAKGSLLPSDRFYPEEKWKVLGPCRR